MNAKLPKVIRVGAALSILAALLAFVIRAAEAQVPTTRRLTLGEAARLAAAQAAGVQGAQQRAEQAQARVVESRSSLLPQFSAIPNWTSHTINSASFGFNFPAPAGEKPLLDPNGQIIGPVHFWDLRAEASQTVFDAATSQRVRAARTSAAASSADVATVAEQAAFTAANAYVHTLRAEALVQARVADSVLANDLVNIAQDQLEAGVGVALDVTRAASQRASSRAQLIAARNDRDRARLELLRALNLALATPLELADSLATVAPVETQTEQAAIDQALRTRPDVRTVDLQFTAAEQQAAAVRAMRLPTVGLFANDGPTGLVPQHFLNTYTYGIQVRWPVFEGGLRTGQAQEAQAAAREIDVHRRDLRQQIAVEVRSALLDLASAREQVDAAREHARLAEQEVEQARERFRAGVSGNADVVNASLSLNTARTGLVDALTAYQAARVALARAEGTVSELR